MSAAFALVAALLGATTLLMLWPLLGWWSVAVAPLTTSVATAFLAVAASPGTSDAPRTDEDSELMSTDEMVAALRSVLPPEPSARPAVTNRRAA